MTNLIRRKEPGKAWETENEGTAAGAIPQGGPLDQNLDAAGYTVTNLDALALTHTVTIDPAGGDEPSLKIGESTEPPNDGAHSQLYTDTADGLLKAKLEDDSVVTIGGSQPSLIPFGDGSDGNIVVNSSVFDFPALTVPDWNDATPYAVGDLVKSTGSNPRVYECVLAGTSGASEPFLDDPPGCQRRGDRRPETSAASTVQACIWEQATSICQGQLEGPIFAADFTVEAGNTLNVHGWPIYARGTATIEATGVLSADGVVAVGATPGAYESGFLDVCTLLGRGVDGQTADQPGLFGEIWGGGLGGYGGVGDDGADPWPGGFSADLLAVSYTLARRTLQTLFGPFFWNLNSAADSPPHIGSTGGGGISDSGNVKSGGASGSAASAGAIFANNLVLAGALTAIGGAGGDGEAGGDTGGGGGSSGGCWIRVYNTQTGAGTVNVNGGAPGQGQGAGTDGTAGGPGEDVEIANS